VPNTISITFKALTSPKLRFAPNSVRQEVLAYMGDFLSDIIDEVRQYPPVPITSDYERTYLLYDSWQVGPGRVMGSGLSRQLLNTAPYAAFVQGDFQTHVHQQHGWIKARTLTRQRSGEYRAGIQKIIRDSIQWG
jgi:hypothetical protein